MSGRRRDKSTIVVRREEVVEGGHHGGAWKVAYADFVTAMMAFFLLMWLLNATTQEQKRGLADYFSPTSHLATAPSGSGAPFGGKTPNSQGQMQSDQGQVELSRSQPYPVTDDDDTGDTPTQNDPSRVPGKVTTPNASDGGATAANAGPGKETALSRLAQDGSETAAAAARVQARAQAQGQERSRQRMQERLQRLEAEKREGAEFERASSQIRDAIAADPGLADLGKQLMVDITPEGLRIQLLDADRTPMFSTGSSSINDRARALLTKIAPVLIKMHEPIAISGHTDAQPYHTDNKTNWDLSADRANATRRLLVDAGLPESRLRSVTGNADRDPLIKDDPLAAGNRRIAVVLLRDAAPAAPAAR